MTATRSFTALALSFLLTMGALASPVATSVIGQPEGQRLGGAALENETLRVSAKLRCPVCQGLSVADSPATMAVQMKHQVRDLLAAGYSERQITEYFEKSYGEFVRLEPQRRGINWIVWLAPLAAFLVGLWLVFGRVRKSATPVAAEGAASEDELAPWIARVREIAYGEKERS